MQITPPASSALPSSPAAPLASARADHAVFRMKAASGDRISGSMPVWGPPETAREQIMQNLSGGTTPKMSGATTQALSLAAQQPAVLAAPDNSFGFLDIVDMVNPLQHIPVVGSIYRAITGDEIKPISQIVGGAAFGGIAGAASGVANALVASRTGKDIGGTVMGWFGGSTSAATAPTGMNDTTLAVTSLAYRRSSYNE